MISIADDNDFTVIIADFIETLAGTGKFTLKIWVSGSELPFKFEEDADFYFMQEGFRASVNNTIVWIFYDTINGMRLDYEN